MSFRYPKGGFIQYFFDPLTVGPNWKQYSGTWPLQQQMQAVAAGTWTGIPLSYGPLIGVGYNGYGSLAQNDVTTYSSPVQIASDKSWSTVASGPGYGTFAIRSDGSLWSWGYNSLGQLGLNDRVDRSSPVQIGALTNWSKVATSGYHVLAIKTDGTLWSWGWNSDGQLGQTQNVSVNRSSPVQIGADTNWSVIACGTKASYAIKTTGTLWSWGSNFFGQLGQNIVYSLNRSSPVQVGALTTWLTVSATYYQSIAETSSNTLFAWGRNNFGQVGDDTRVDRSSPVQIGALTTWLNINCGYGNALATTSDNKLWAWGSNTQGNLGQNNRTNRSSPVQVGTDTFWKTPFSTNASNGCIRTDNTLWVWGANSYGNLGQNDTIYRSSPVQLGTASNWLSGVVGTPGSSFFGIQYTTT